MRMPSGLMTLCRAIASGDPEMTTRILASAPGLARDTARVGATRSASTSYFLDEIGHYLYAGDTPLHIAAAAYREDISRVLIDRGADVRATNRHGAAPLHYAADGAPGSDYWNPTAQAATITYLIDAGA